MSISGITQNIGQLLEKATAGFGDKIAIHFIEENLSLTYKELNRQINRYANTLREKGIRQGDHVAVMLPNCPDYPLTWLALAKLGAVTVPLNTAYQAQDMEYVLNNSDACALVIHIDYLPVFQEIAEKTPAINIIFTSGEQPTEQGEPLSKLVEKASDDFTLPAAAADDIMNIQYTSGTTGFPKGCLLTHEYWLIYGMYAAKHMTMTESDVFLGVAPFYYIDAQWELIMCISAGGAMVVGKKYSASGFMSWVRKYNVTVAFATMAAWTFKQPESPLDKQHHLKIMMVGQFPAQLQRAFEERFNVPLRAGYGMTESGPATSISFEDGHMTGSGSVGKLDELREARIVDEMGKDVPQGEIGELLLKGPGMMTGYYKKPEATAETLVDGWLHTGDLFRMDENGYFYIVGRKKEMIKRSGENVSAIEVENLLKSHPKIANAAVIAVPDENRFEEVKAYIVPLENETSQTIPPGEIIEFCKGKIAEFKIPRYIEYQKSFKLTSVGKVIKEELSADKENLTANCYDRMASQGK
ncbi:MAG: AMP-binding protein [SAR324 cluster bacterium]|nr:AMP-binding protein [SAR324 cluster bacterium]